MIPDIPHNIRKRLANWNFCLLCPDVAKLRQPKGQRLSNVRMQQTKISIGPILFLYYEECLVSSNLNSKELRFHGAHHGLQIDTYSVSVDLKPFLFSKFDPISTPPTWEIFLSPMLLSSSHIMAKVKLACKQIYSLG